MFDHQRHQLIVETLKMRSPLLVPELVELLGASPATIRRDLSFLEKIGKIARTHGGAMHPDQVDGELSFDRKSRSALKAKLAIARAATRLAKSGDTVFVDAGTTALEVGKRLVSMERLTVITNSVPLLSEQPAAGTRLIGVGGEIRALSLALVGSIALDWLGRLTIDVAFLGTSGIDPDEGPTTTELSEASVKSAVVAKARRTILLAEASKWGTPAAVRYADWEQVGDFFTDRRFTAQERRKLKQKGATVHTVAK